MYCAFTRLNIGGRRAYYTIIINGLYICNSLSLTHTHSLSSVPVRSVLTCFLVWHAPTCRLERDVRISNWHSNGKGRKWSLGYEWWLWCVTIVNTMERNENNFNLSESTHLFPILQLGRERAGHTSTHQMRTRVSRLYRGTIWVVMVAIDYGGGCQCRNQLVTLSPS